MMYFYTRLQSQMTLLCPTFTFWVRAALQSGSSSSSRGSGCVSALFAEQLCCPGRRLLLEKTEQKPHCRFTLGTHRSETITGLWKASSPSRSAVRPKAQTKSSQTRDLHRSWPSALAAPSYWSASNAPNALLMDTHCKLHFCLLSL